MGILDGVKIIEMAGIGPAPFCGMLLADHGAEVIRIDRPNPGIAGMLPREKDVLARGRRSIIVDTKSEEGIEIIKKLCADADAIFEGLRPGAMERMGLGPDDLKQVNSKLVYGRVTGWGQEGPLAKAAGHDINYLALSGNLHTYGRAGEKPTPPINLAADFAGGAMFLAFGMVAAIMKARETGQGQVIDCAMTDGAALLAGTTWTFHNAGMWSSARGTNLLDTGAHFYDTYETQDGKFVSIGSIEPQFYAQLLSVLDLQEDADFLAQMDAKNWSNLRDRLEAVFKTKTCSEWCELMEGTDICFAPVLDMDEAPLHEHNRTRNVFAKVNGDWQPNPAPRFSDDKPKKIEVPEQAGAQTKDILSECGYDEGQIDRLISAGTVIQND